MTRNILFIATFPFLFTTMASAQNARKPKTVVVENKKITTTRNSCTEPCSNVTFYEFMKHFKEHNGFDSEKLREAEMAAGGDCFTSKQIRIILSGFTYESTRIEFAKFAYDYVYDKSDFAAVKEGLHNASSWDEVEEYIKHR